MEEELDELVQTVLKEYEQKQRKKVLSRKLGKNLGAA